MDFIHIYAIFDTTQIQSLEKNTSTLEHDLNKKVNKIQQLKEEYGDLKEEHEKLESKLYA